MNLSALSHVTSNVLNTQRLWTLVYAKFQAASWRFAPDETAKMQPRQPTPKRNLQRTSKHKISKKCCVDASSKSFLATHLKWRKPLGNAPQNTNPVSRAHPKLRFGSWQRTWNYKTHLKSHCRLPCQHAAGMRIWERNAGRGETPPKTSEGWKNNRKPEKTANQSWFWTSHDFKVQNTQRYGQRTNENICKPRSPSRKWTAHLDFWKTGYTATQQGRTKKNDIIRNEQLATVVLKFKLQVADKSDIKSTTIETCIIDKLKLSSLNVADNILCM